MNQIQTQIVQTNATPTAGIRRVVAATDIAAFFDHAYTAVVQAVQQQGGVITGPAFARYFSVPSDTFDLEAGFPTEAALNATGELVIDSLPAGLAARAVHLGSYDRLPQAWQELDAWIQEQGLVRSGPMWEVYVTMPTPEGNPEDMRTDVFVAVQ